MIGFRRKLQPQPRATDQELPTTLQTGQHRPPVNAACSSSRSPIPSGRQHSEDFDAGQAIALAITATTTALSGAGQAHGDTVDEMRRADTISLHKVAFMYAISGPLGPTLYPQQAELVCIAKTPGSLDFVITPSNLGMPEVTLPMHFHGQALPDGRVQWKLDEPINQCVTVALGSSNQRRVSVGHLSGIVEGRVTTMGAVPTVECGSARQSLVALYASDTPGAARITFDANAECPPGPFGGTVSIFGFSFTGSFSVPALRQPSPRAAPLPRTRT